MSRIKKIINSIALNLKTTVTRFPIALLFLASITTIVYIEIERNFTFDDDLLQRLVFSGIVGAFLAITVQFMLERFKNLSKYTLLFHGFTFVLATSYYFFMTSDDISQSILIHLFVITFALFAAYLYIPSAKNSVNFGNVALSHFKAAFTSLLYGFVLYLGFAAITGAIDLLLYELDYDVYSHIANIVFTFFTPVYYLSLLPKFNSEDEKDAAKKEVSYSFPRVLEILVSYIMIPLISIFSIVLIIYFIKILVTGVWPVGQVGPMVLGYSAAGYLIYILGTNLQNRFSILFRKFFPMVLIPLVVMQLVSSYIRIEAYGITESRYYVVLFGIFSIITAVVLIFSKKKNPNTIVLLAACFAILSIIPPVDAFSVSMNSQEARLEEILERNNMLVNNELVPNSDIPNEDKYELTSITYYMVRMGYLSQVEWFPEEYSHESDYYGNFEKIYGFSEYYDDNSSGVAPLYVYAALDQNKEIDVAGFDKFIKVNINKNSNSSNLSRKIGNLTLEGNEYTIEQKSIGDDEIIISILDNQKNIVIEKSMKELTDNIFKNVNESKALMSPEELTINAQNEKMQIRIVVSDINIDKSNSTNVNIDGTIFIFAKLLSN